MKNFTLKIFFSLMVSPSCFATPKSHSTAEKIDPAVVAKFAVENFRTPYQALFALVAFGFSNDSLRPIIQDMRNNQVDIYKKMPMDLRKNEIILDGKPTGIKVTSFSPFNVQYKGNTWSYSPKDSVDENYSSLVKFLKGERQTSFFDFFVPSAQADGWDDAKFMGGIAGIFATGGAMTVAIHDIYVNGAAAFNETGTAMGPVGLGDDMAAFGGVAAAASVPLALTLLVAKDSEPNPGNVKMSCSKNKVSFSILNDEPRTLESWEIDKNASGYTVTKSVPSSHGSAKSQVDTSQDKQVWDVMAACSKPEQAKEFENKYLDAAKNLHDQLNSKGQSPSNSGSGTTVTQ